MIDLDVEQTRHERTVTAVKSSYDKMRSFRNINTEMFQEYAGTQYGENQAEHGDRLVHKLSQAVDGYMMLLAADRPSVLITANNMQYMAFAKHFQDNLNLFLESIDFEHIVKRMVMDALFCVGVTRVHIGDAAEEEEVEEGVFINTGEPTVSNIALDNLVVDMAANEHREMQYVGDRYRLPYEDLKAGIEDGTYNDEAKELKPTAKETSDAKRLEEISNGRRVDDDELEPMIDLANIWTRRDQMIRTYAVTRPFTLISKPIGKFEWTGPKEGPYGALLAFNMIPENIMPSSLVADWMPLDQAINNLMRQQNRRAVNLKENPVYTPDSQDLAKNIDDAKDMQWVKSTEPKETKVVKTGGADAGTQALIESYIQKFDEGAGNLTSLLGLGAQSDTVGQEQLIHSAGNRMIGRMQSAVTSATTRLVKSIAKLLWDDEFKVIQNRVSVSGYSAQSNWTPGERYGKFTDYTFNVHSMPYQGPAERMETINRLVTQVYLPMQETLQQQGGSIDMAELSELHAELLNAPRLERVIAFNNKPQEPGPPGDGPGKSPFSHREYVRKSSPGNPQRQAQQVTQMIPESSNGDGN